MYVRQQECSETKYFIEHLNPTELYSYLFRICFAVPPRLTFTITPQTINETQSATLSCVVTAANPSANITLRSPTNESIPHTSGTAVLTNRTRNDAGIYSCVADNGLDGSPVTITSTLTVNRKYMLSCFRNG